MRFGIRRFRSVELKGFKQSWNTERVEEGNRNAILQSRTARQTPRAMGTAGDLSREVSADVPLAQFRKPHLAGLPVLPDRGSQPVADPHRGIAAKMIR
jgi:hypothetical protein